MNGLARRTQIWYYDNEWGRQIAEDVIQNIPKECVTRDWSRPSEGIYEIVLLDGSEIEILPVTCHSRKRADDVYLQAGMNQELFEDVAARCMGGSIRVLTEYRDLFRISKGYPVDSFYYN